MRLQCCMLCNGWLFIHSQRSVPETMCKHTAEPQTLFVKSSIDSNSIQVDTQGKKRAEKYLFSTLFVQVFFTDFCVGKFWVHLVITSANETDFFHFLSFQFVPSYAYIYKFFYKLVLEKKGFT